jgi:hypothetical protein
MTVSTPETWADCSAWLFDPMSDGATKLQVSISTGLSPKKLSQIMSLDSWYENTALWVILRVSLVIEWILSVVSRLHISAPVSISDCSAPVYGEYTKIHVLWWFWVGVAYHKESHIAGSQGEGNLNDGVIEHESHPKHRDNSEKQSQGQSAKSGNN